MVVPVRETVPVKELPSMQPLILQAQIPIEIQGFSSTDEHLLYPVPPSFLAGAGNNIDPGSRGALVQNQDMFSVGAVVGSSARDRGWDSYDSHTNSVVDADIRKFSMSTNRDAAVDSRGCNKDLSNNNNRNSYSDYKPEGDAKDTVPKLWSTAKNLPQSETQSQSGATGSASAIGSDSMTGSITDSATISAMASTSGRTTTQPRHRHSHPDSVSI
jgi:hypothetical protein